MNRSLKIGANTGNCGFFTAPVKKHTETRIEWLTVDCNGKSLGRVASEISKKLLGKHDPQYTPNVRSFAINCIGYKNVVLTGNKEEDKRYYEYSGYLGGLKERTFEQLNQRREGEAIFKAVKGMMPKTYRQHLHRFLRFVDEGAK